MSEKAIWDCSSCCHASPGMHLCLSLCLSLSIWLFLFLFLSLSVCLSVCLSFTLSLSLSLSISLSLSLSLYLSLYLVLSLSRTLSLSHTRIKCMCLDQCVILLLSGSGLGSWGAVGWRLATAASNFRWSANSVLSAWARSGSVCRNIALQYIYIIYNKMHSLFFLWCFTGKTIHSTGINVIDIAQDAVDKSFLPLIQRTERVVQEYQVAVASLPVAAWWTVGCPCLRSMPYCIALLYVPCNTKGMMPFKIYWEDIWYI